MQVGSLLPSPCKIPMLMPMPMLLLMLLLLPMSVTQSLFAAAIHYPLILDAVAVAVVCTGLVNQDALHAHRTFIARTRRPQDVMARAGLAPAATRASPEVEGGCQTNRKLTESWRTLPP